MAYADEVANLAAEIDGLDATIVQKEVMIAAENVSVIPGLVEKLAFDGPGLKLQMPYINATDWSASALAEGAATTFADIDIEDKTATVVKYVIDWPISLEGASYGAANAIAAAIKDAGRGYAKKVSGLIHAAINADTDLDVTDTTALDPADLVAAKQKMLSGAVPGPHTLVLHPEHWTDLVAASGVTLGAMTNPAPITQAVKNGQIAGLAGFETYIDPYCVGTGVGASGTAAMSVFFGSEGVRWVYKNTMLPDAANGEMGIRIYFNDEYRAWVISGTMFGVAAVVRSGETTPWVGNLYLSA